MTRYVDFATDLPAVGRCIVLPGRQYTPDGPLLFFAAQVALARGWDVRQVWWEAPERYSDGDEITWVCDQLEAAVGDDTRRTLVIAKSLGTLGAVRAAERGYEAAWFTPILTDPEAAAPLLDYPAAQLVVIGSSDPFLDNDVLARLPGEQIVVDGDHILRVPGDPAAMLRSHEQAIGTFDRWMLGL